MSTTIIPGPNVFRAVSGSLFSSPINWSRGYVPTGSDVADIRDNCIIDISRTIGGLLVQPGFTASINTGLTLRMGNVINVLGSISSSGTPTILSLSSKNIVNNFQAGLSTFHYSGSVNQNVFGGTYYNLVISNTGIKTVSSNLSISGSVTVNPNSTLELGNSDLFVSGVFAMNTATLSKKGFGSIIFNDTVFPSGRVDLPGSPIVEFRNGINLSYGFPNIHNFGNSVVRFTTRDQSIIGNTSLAFTSDILISGPNTLTIDISQGVVLYGFVNGTDPLSKIISRTALSFLTARSVERCMVTGTLDITSFNNNVAIDGNHVSTLSPTFSSFRNLSINNGLKTAGANMFISGTFNTNTFELGNFNLTVTGSSTIQFPGPLSKSGPGNVTFIGNTNISNAGFINFSGGNPTVELRGGITNTGNGGITSGTGSWNFTTNNQTINSNNNLTFDAPISIQNIAVTCSGNGGIILNRPINGNTAGSIIVNRANITFATAASLTGSLLTGSYDFNSSVNTIGIGGNYTATIPARFSSSFYNLSILGTGTKSLASNMYLSGAFYANASYFNNSSSNITISGSTLFQNYSTWINTGGGSIKFIGPLRFGVTFTDRASMDFSVGNPNVEVQNGAYFNTNYGEYYQPGKGTWTFTTNNQNVFVNGGAQRLEFNNLVVSGAITLCTTASTLGSPGPGIIQISGSLNGTEANSKFVIGENSYLYLNTLTPPMTTGSLDTSSYVHTLGYVYNGNQTVPYNTYKSLYISGNATKSLAQNTVVNNNLNISAIYPSANSVSFDNASYSLVVSGSTIVEFAGTLINTGGGPLTFIGPLKIGVAFTSNAHIDLSAGNPNVELRNGLYLFQGYSEVFKMGTGSYTFTTNNQDLYIFGGGGIANFKKIIISGSITLTLSSSLDFGGAFLYINESIDGTEANSRFRMSTNSNLYYNATQQPMLTGSVDFSSSLNGTFIYNSGSQNVRGGTYRNLTFLNGLKTLQGNVSVLGTFSTGSGATSASINLNGFTLTNP